MEDCANACTHRLHEHTHTQTIIQKHLFNYGNTDINKLLSLLTLVLLLGPHSRKCFPIVKLQSAKQPLWDTVSFDLNRHQSRSCLFWGGGLDVMVCVYVCVHMWKRECCGQWSWTNCSAVCKLHLSREQCS